MKLENASSFADGPNRQRTARRRCHLVPRCAATEGGARFTEMIVLRPRPHLAGCRGSGTRVIATPGADRLFGPRQPGEALHASGHSGRKADQLCWEEGRIRSSGQLADPRSVACLTSKQQSWREMTRADMDRVPADFVRVRLRAEALRHAGLHIRTLLLLAPLDATTCAGP